MRIEPLTGKPKIRVIRTLTHVIPTTNGERKLTRERVIFKGSEQAFKLWQQTHELTSEDTIERLDVFVKTRVQDYFAGSKIDQEQKAQ